MTFVIFLVFKEKVYAFRMFLFLEDDMYTKQKKIMKISSIVLAFMIVFNSFAGWIDQGDDFFRTQVAKITVVYTWDVGAVAFFIGDTGCVIPRKDELAFKTNLSVMMAAYMGKKTVQAVCFGPLASQDLALPSSLRILHRLEVQD